MKQTLRAIFALATLALAGLTTQASAALTTIGGPMWPPPGSTGLETVQFNVQTAPVPGSPASSATIALGAHAYKNGPLLPNDGVSVYTAMLGTYLAEDRANWSFDFAVDTRDCLACVAKLEIDTDPGIGHTFITLFSSMIAGGVYGESWNMEMAFIEALLPGGNFDPNQDGERGFRFSLFGPQGGDAFMSRDISIITGNGPGTVPEPASLALLLLAVGGLYWTRRDKKASNDDKMAAMPVAA